MEGNRNIHFIEAFFSAAKAEDWDRVDREFVPQLVTKDANSLTELLLRDENVNNQDPNIRDAVATALGGITITNEEQKRKAIDEMVEMVAKDPIVYPAGRAAVFLLKYMEDEVEGQRIANALNFFKHRVTVERWQEELREDIPELEGLLK